MMATTSAESAAAVIMNRVCAFHSASAEAAVVVATMESGCRLRLRIEARRASPSTGLINSVLPCSRFRKAATCGVVCVLKFLPMISST